jgi:hypothetical protein
LRSNWLSAIIVIIALSLPGIKNTACRIFEEAGPMLETISATKSFKGHGNEHLALDDLSLTSLPAISLRHRFERRGQIHADERNRQAPSGCDKAKSSWVGRTSHLHGRAQTASMNRPAVRPGMKHRPGMTIEEKSVRSAIPE